MGGSGSTNKANTNQISDKRDANAIKLNSEKANRKKIKRAEAGRKLKKSIKELLSTPLGWIAFWLAIGIVGSGATLFFVLIGATDVDDPDRWIEINVQILTAIFTLLAISNQPLRLYYFYLWVTKSEKLKKYFVWGLDFYGRMFLVILLLNLNTFTQYPITVVVWGWGYENRPEIIIAVFLPISFITGLLGGVLAGVFENKWKKIHKRTPSQQINPTQAATGQGITQTTVTRNYDYAETLQTEE